VNSIASSKSFVLLLTAKTQMQSLTQCFADRLFNLFVESQLKFMAVLLRNDCKPSYNAQSRTLAIECDSERLFRVLRSKADRLVFPAILSDVKILLKVSEANCIDLKSAAR
jgi:hypothetical protein